MAKATAKAPAPYPSKVVPPRPGDIAEVFSGIQGEGSFVGERQLFIRMGGCPYRCHYCDTPNALVPDEFCLVEDPPASRKFRKVKNPVAPDALRSIAAGFIGATGLHRAITITGGEPLWQASYLKEALPLLKSFGRKILLETAGTHVEELKSVLEFIDIVALDIKPPSSTAMKPMWSAHREFLRVALVKEVIVKIVVTRTTHQHDLEMTRDLVAEVDRTVPVILQPVSPAWKVKVPPTISQLLSWQALFAEKLERVRIIPQIHRVLGDM